MGAALRASAGCCTVLVDGSPRVACVTPARRVAGRRITTVEGLAPAERGRWADAFVATGASQCGFCTPGIIVRLAAAAGSGPVSEDQTRPLPSAHLCRCTGWRSVLEAAAHLPAADPRGRDLAAAGRRATIEGGTTQHVGPDVALGRGGFADDLAPADALVAVSDGRGMGRRRDASEARRAAQTVQGRRTTRIGPPLEGSPGDRVGHPADHLGRARLRRARRSWCRPGGEPTRPLGNGGAFGAKLSSPAPAAARRLADQYGRPVVCCCPGRTRCASARSARRSPPAWADGSGVVHVVRTPGVAERIAAIAPTLAVEEVDVAGPPTSVRLRAAGWVESAVLLAASAPRGPSGHTTAVVAGSQWRGRVRRR